MRIYPDIGVQIPEVLLPKKGTDLQKWAVIACDQFTSQPEYWQQVENNVAGAPSTYNLILPEVHLEAPDVAARIAQTQASMRTYLDEGLFDTHEGMILIERSVAGRTRHGLILALDLEKYDFSKGSQTLIRATEGTILERIPPRVRIREGAPLELPHILVLIDDPYGTVIQPLIDKKDELPSLYQTELMLGSGQISAAAVTDPMDEAKVIGALRALSNPETFQQRYAVSADLGVLLFAMGDGNHSLATAKTIWEKVKPQVGLSHPARFALVEIENVHDEGLIFEPIHRVVFDVNEELAPALARHFGANFRLEACADDEMIARVQNHSGREQCVGCATHAGSYLLYMTQPTSNLAVGSLQAFLDAWLKENKTARIDYVHGDEVVTRLGKQPGNASFYLPGMQKGDLFKTVILDGALPRKTFSMGEAIEKRFYMEARKIV
jgi:hypothetical protein